MNIFVKYYGNVLNFTFLASKRNVHTFPLSIMYLIKSKIESGLS